MTQGKKQPKNLYSWQKKYGPGYVLYSTKTGRALCAGSSAKIVLQKAEKEKINMKTATLIYVPGFKTKSVYSI